MEIKNLKKISDISGQLTGSALSIVNNIAEGFDAGNNVEFMRFLRYSRRSCSEIMSMTYVLKDVYTIRKEIQNII